MEGQKKNRSSSLSDRSYYPRKMKNLQFPHVYIKETTNHSSNPKNTKPSSLAQEIRESFLQVSYDNYDDSYQAQAVNPDIARDDVNRNASGTQIKIHFNVPKLAAIVNFNKGPTKTYTGLSHRNTRGSYSDQANLGSPFPYHAASFDDENTPSPKHARNREHDISTPPTPTIKPISFSSRVNNRSPRLQESPAKQQLHLRHPTQDLVPHQHDSLAETTALKQYTDPLTQEKTYLSSEAHDTVHENKSLKELLVDALEDFYLRHDNIPPVNDYDVQTLQRAGIPTDEIQAIHEEINTKRTAKSCSIHPNLTTVPVSSTAAGLPPTSASSNSNSNPATSRKSTTDSEIMPVIFSLPLFSSLVD